MGTKKKRGITSTTVITQKIFMMGSGGNSQADSTHRSHVSFAIAETPVNEHHGSSLQVDDDNTTDEASSEGPGTWDTSLEVDEEADRDAISIYSPSHYPRSSMRRGFESAFDDRATLNSTRSLMSSEIDYVWEHGRRYVGDYYIPNDEEELVRQAVVNQVYLSAFDRELTSVPLEDPTHILDIGTGTGEWCIAMAEVFPDCDITGTDIADVFAKEIPANVFPEYDNAEWPWERTPDSYDLVHLRNMDGAFRDWPFIYGEAFRVIKPGGWIEVIDLDDHKGFRNFLSFFDEGSAMLKVTHDVEEASILSGRPRGIAHLEPRLLYDAGFEDVNITDHTIPLSPKEMSTGKLWLVAVLAGMEATTLRLLTKYKGWSAEEVRTACDMMAEELKTLSLNRERAKGFVIKVRVLTGRKPIRPTNSGTGGQMDIDENDKTPVDDARSMVAEEAAPQNHVGEVDGEAHQSQSSRHNDGDDDDTTTGHNVEGGLLEEPRSRITA